MPHSEARVVLESPGRYLGQICKHFAHKLPVTLEEARGSIAFPMGTCRLEAADGLLVLRAEAEGAEALERLQEVVARHLLRFAFRTPPEIDWLAREAG
ncbi:DUF2218 domain-containing protein [Belnapia sp. T18]|uniref:DUF2218 domain-containing protein n=1 Tax=Belnapia arida TaxID=2804533 RepID=A0ABS1U682_9PROT|nr:DUF2218 domain-containing protein [Belnapia arida]MBL6080194.1 DUF2218 domain-containing protein [Belnapia arida]